jgi:hypothetical protein
VALDAIAMRGRWQYVQVLVSAVGLIFFATLQPAHHHQLLEVCWQRRVEHIIEVPSARRGRSGRLVNPQ